VKVGIDCRDLRAGSLTGIGRFVRNLLRSLADEDSPPTLYLYGNQHTVFPFPRELSSASPRTRRTKEAATWWWDRVSLPRQARHDRLDVFLSPYFKAPGIRSCPVVITIHDLLFLRMPPELSGRSAVYSRAFRSFAASFARRAAAVLTVSEHSRNDIVQLLDVPAKKVHVVGNCVEAEFHPADGAAIEKAKRSYRLHEEYILYVGSFSPHKNLDGLLQMYAGLSDGVRSKYQLVLAGRADKWTPKTRDKVKDLGLSDRVKIPGHIDENDLPAIYAGASAFATLSRWEGFGLPVIEAMACGTPVLCSDRTSLPEVAGSAAALVDPDDLPSCSKELERVLTDASLRQELRPKGLERAKQFSPKRFATLVLDVLSSVIDAQ